MADERDPSMLSGVRDADRILDYVHGRYRRRKRIQQGSLSVMTVLVLAVATASVVNNLRSRPSLRSITAAIGPHDGASSFLSLACHGVAESSVPESSTGTRGGSRPLAAPGVASKVVDAVVNLEITVGP